MKENAVLLGVQLPFDSYERLSESLQELKELSKTAGAVVIDTLIQQRKDIDSKYYIGKGKVEEIKSFYSGKNVTLAVFNHELTPTQIRNLEKELNLKVITRTELILDIFALHARTKISKLQVELAQLSYELPRISGKGIWLSRLGGGIGTRGPGEQQLELDRRLIQRKIYLIRKKLKEAEKERQEQRKNRSSNEFKIAIVGYTNSGKSSLLKRLTKADVLIEDQLFATLDTTTRKIWLGYRDNKPVYAVITDTVGFIRDLPHGLIESFKSTLEDTLQADLLIHIIDISTHDFTEKKEVIKNTLTEIGASAIPVLNCFNKIDLLPEKKILEYRLLNPESIFISARDDINIDILKKKILNYYLHTLKAPIRAPLKAKLL